MLSRMKEQSFEELKARLVSRSGLSVFGRTSSQHWAEAYRFSYDCAEAPNEAWPTHAQLRAAVKRRVKDELPYITDREEGILRRMMLFGGTTPLLSDEELSAADSLLRRLWCSCVIRDDGRLFLQLAEPLAKPMLQAVEDDAYFETRGKMRALSATLHSMVYLHGMLYAQPALKHLSGHLLPSQDEYHLRLLNRYLMAEFDYCLDRQGNLVLMHPGLVCPERMLASLSNARYQATDYTREMILGGMSELLKEEEAANDILSHELGFALQPGYNPNAFVNDLKILVKQGASHDQLTGLIRDKLAIRMTPQIENALLRVETDTVRWQSAPSRRLN